MDVLDLEGIDDDLDLEEEAVAMETDLDRPMSRLSVMPDSERPTANELRLGKRLATVEKERDNLAAELEALKTKHAPATSTTVPVPPSGPVEEKIEIPHALLPILDVMRHHISELTRDNQAMRYTFGLDLPIATSSKVTLDSSVDSSTTAHTGEKRLDLKAVVERVRALVKENEELGDMVLEAGRVDTEEWEQALEDSQKVITSLDADLQHHAETVQKLRQELEGYRTLSSSTSSAQTPKAGSSRDLISPPPRSQNGASQDGRGQRGGRDDRRHDSRRGHGQNDRGNTNSQRDRDRDRERDRDRDRNREKDRHRDTEKEREKEKVVDRPKDKHAGLSIRGASAVSAVPPPPNDFGPGIRREDDRASKRRK